MAEQIQARTLRLVQQQSDGPANADIVQLQHSMRSLEANLQHIRAAQTGDNPCWQAVHAALNRLDTTEEAVCQLQDQHATKRQTSIDEKVLQQVQICAYSLYYQALEAKEHFCFGFAKPDIQAAQFSTVHFLCTTAFTQLVCVKK